MTIVIIATAVLGLYMAWTIGANDVANSMGAAVGSKSITAKRAILIAAACEFAGAVLVGSHVTDTVRKGIVDPAIFHSMPALLAVGMICALLASALWLHASTWLGMPVSTTHSIVGAVAGFGIAAAGWGAVYWGKIGEIVASWFISPVAGGIVAFIVFKFISHAILGSDQPARAAARLSPLFVFVTALVVLLATLYKGLANLHLGALTGWPAIAVAVGLSIAFAMLSGLLIGRRLDRCRTAPLGEQLECVEQVFAPLVVVTSCCVAFAHGANDVANAVGPLAAVADIMHTGVVNVKAPAPFWVLALGGVGIVIGLATFGYRVMQTVGVKITQLTPSRGIAANIAATATVLVCSRMKLPISTTHTLVGAILGVGFARGVGAINRRVTGNIFGSWFITVPATALLTMGLFLLARALHVDIHLQHMIAAATSD